MGGRNSDRNEMSSGGATKNPLGNSAGTGPLKVTVNGAGKLKTHPPAIEIDTS